MKRYQGIFCLWLLTATGSMALSVDAQAAVLGSGQSMPVGQRLYSSNHRYFAALQTDGDFAVTSVDGRTIWSTGTRGSGAVRADMQRDGNFVLHDAGGNPVWSTRTHGRHRMFGVSSWGQPVVINARHWKPRRKDGEPTVENVLRRRGKLDWQPNASDAASGRGRHARQASSPRQRP